MYFNFYYFIYIIYVYYYYKKKQQTVIPLLSKFVWTEKSGEHSFGICVNIWLWGRFLNTDGAVDVTKEMVPIQLFTRINHSDRNTVVPVNSFAIAVHGNICIARNYGDGFAVCGAQITCFPQSAGAAMSAVVLLGDATRGGLALPSRPGPGPPFVSFAGFLQFQIFQPEAVCSVPGKHKTWRWRCYGDR